MHNKAIADYNEAIRLKADDALTYYDRASLTGEKAISTRPLPTTARRSGSNLTLRRRIATGASLMTRRATLTRPSPTALKRCASILTMP